MATSNAHLPLSLSSFVGRTEELAKLEQLEKLGARLITLAGPGGAGKTRLASEYSRRRVEGGKRVFFVDVTREATVAGTIVDILAPGAPASQKAAIDALRRHASHGLMVVLDGLEHVVMEAADIVPAILNIDGLIVLGTSREPLRLRGEQVVRVGALSDEEAIELFALRARLLMPDFDPGTDSGDAIREIVQRVDGLPLGIELAAARVNVLPPKGLADRLTNRMSALKSKDRDRPERHRSIAATARWSWELLDQSERDVLMQLAALRGNFTIEAAEAVVYLDEGTVVEILETLVERSILEPLADGTFRLFQTVHGMALNELNEDEWREEVFKRHADYFANLAFDTPRHRRGEMRDALMELILAANRTTGATRASALAGKGAIVAERGGIGPLVEEMVDAVGDADDDQVRAELLLAAARGYLDRMQLAEARRVAARAQAAATKADLVEVEVQAWLVTVMSFMWGGDFENAVAHIPDLVDAIDRSDSVNAETRARSVIARAYLEVGRIRDAEDEVAQALNRARGAEDEFVLARTLADVGMWRVKRGAWVDAETLLSESIELFDELDESRHLPRALLALARIKTAANDLEAARDLYIRTERVARDFGLVGLRLEALIGAGSLRFSQGDRVYLIRAVDIASETAAGQTEFLARSMLVLFDMRFASFPLAQHQIRRVAGDHVPTAWEETMQALSSLMSGWEGTEEGLPEETESAWADALNDVVRAFHDAPSSGATTEQISRIRGALDTLEATTDDRLADWPTQHVVHVLDTLLADRYAAESGPVLQLDREGRNFTPPGGETVDYSRRGALRRVLVGLAEYHDEAPGEALTLDDVLECGWPGEIVTPEAGASRVYSAIRTLRNHGLDACLQTNDEGYLFAPELKIVWTE